MTPLWVAGVPSVGAPSVGPWPLSHGVSAAKTLWDNGFVALGLRDASRSAALDGVVLTFQVRAVLVSDRPPALRSVPQDAGLIRRPGEEPVRVQRLAAYAVVTSPRGVLLVQFSAATNAPGRWGPPGGGVDPGEEPQAALAREVVEETGQRVRITRPRGVVDRHWVGRAPDGRLEDFHAVGVVWDAVCDEPSAPHVHDVGGTTSHAAWVPSAQVAGLPLLDTWRDVLEQAAGSAFA